MPPEGRRNFSGEKARGAAKILGYLGGGNIGEEENTEPPKAAEKKINVP